MELRPRIIVLILTSLSSTLHAVLDNSGTDGVKKHIHRNQIGKTNPLIGLISTNHREQFVGNYDNDKCFLLLSRHAPSANDLIITESGFFAPIRLK